MSKSSSRDPPILPPIRVRLSFCSSISPMSEVVVVLPLLPVMPIMGAGQRSTNRQISDVMGTPADSAIFKYGDDRGTAGLATIKSVFRKSVSSCPSSTKAMGNPFRARTEARRSFFGRKSVTVTTAPSRTRKRTAPTPPPNNPNPITVTRWPFKSTGSLRVSVGTGLKPVPTILVTIDR